MIEFSGEMSKKCIRYIIIKEGTAAWITGGVISILLITPTVVASISSGELIYLLFVPILLFIPILTGPPIFIKKELVLVIPSRIAIEDDGLMVCESKKFHLEVGIENVHKVIDVGDWYHVIFKYGYKTNRYVCEKKLLTKGSLEEFEKLFSDKLERK